MYAERSLSRREGRVLSAEKLTISKPRKISSRIVGVISATAGAAYLALTPASLELPQDEQDQAFLLSEGSISEGPLDLEHVHLNTDVLPLLSQGREVRLGEVILQIRRSTLIDGKTVALAEPIIAVRTVGHESAHVFSHEYVRSWFNDIILGNTKATVRKIDAKDLTGEEQTPAFAYKIAHRGLKIAGKDTGIILMKDLKKFLLALANPQYHGETMHPNVVGYFPRTRSEIPLGFKRIPGVNGSVSN